VDDVIALPALAQSALLRDGEVSVEELARAYHARVERLDGRFGAFAQYAPAAALRRARALDGERRRDPAGARGPLWGLVTAMKDLHLVRGMFVRLGSRAFRYLWSPVDDVTTRAVRSAGLLVTGKLSTSELGILPVVHPAIHPPTRSPWDVTRYAGGSSGGSAAAVSAGMMPLAVGSDGAGSIRIPAAFCGLVGHKPTRGLLPNPFARLEPVSLATVGPIARTVDDAAALLDALRGDRGLVGTFRGSIERPPRPLRVRFTAEHPEARCDDDARAALRAVVETLERLGHHVAEGRASEGTTEEFLPMFRFLARGMIVPAESALEPVSRWLRAAGRGVTLADALAARELFRARVDATFAEADLVVTPTVLTLPPRVGAWEGLPPDRCFAEAAPYGAFTAAYNAAGCPATTIPVWLAPDAPPRGVQLAAPRGHDVRTLAVARAVLEALGTPVCPLGAQAR
jgi:amidase